MSGGGFSGGEVVKTSNTHRAIDICDPQRWGLKYGEKRQWYFKMRLDFFADPDINRLEYRSILLFLGIIKQSLRLNSASVKVCLEYYKDILRCSLGDIKVSLRELESFNIISLQVKVRSQLIEENRREENRREQSCKTTFDFNSTYALYPRKSGKTKGFEKCNTQIKTQNDFDLLLSAVKNYAEECHANKTELRYIKQFSTFMGCWRDYLEIEIPVNPFDLFEEINPSDQPIIKRLSE